MSVNQMKQDADSEKIPAVIPQHVEWLRTKISEGIIVQAGKWGNTGGMAIVKAGSEEEASGILSEDPLISSGLVTYVIAELAPLVEIA